VPGRRHRSPDWAGPPDVLARLRAAALDAQALLLELDPILGEPATQRAVDDFVEYAADALRAVAELTDGPLRETRDAGSRDADTRDADTRGIHSRGTEPPAAVAGAAQSSLQWHRRPPSW
jgi:hypothetical protein